jgi:hypothetical protein
MSIDAMRPVVAGHGDSVRIIGGAGLAYVAGRPAGANSPERVDMRKVESRPNMPIERLQGFLSIDNE